MSEGPMSFMHLDMLADILHHDLREMASDFEIKSQFCKEQEQKCLDNAINLLSVDQLLGSLNCCMLKLEMDLNENETNLIEAEKTVSRLERNCQINSKNPSPRVYPLARATYEDLLEQLLATEKTAVQFNNIKNEIEAFHQESVEKLAPGSVLSQITKLISYHTSTLESMEKQIQDLETHVNQLQSEFERLMEDKKCTAKCPCQPTGNYEPMDTS
ncbi:uncharacterized protein [Drosophila kikkawai]|uniref:Uncharacterized protein isoform X1 n=1 Tax=Drosophila kikkawai TaxID=30033 RepID=A0ABM4GKU7_DROKI